jgi:hypothetical protein
MAHPRNTPHSIELRYRLPHALAGMMQKGRREGCHEESSGAEIAIAPR